MKILAQTFNLPGGYQLQGPEGFSSDITSIGSLIAKVIPFIFAVAGFGLLLMLLAGGFSFLTSAGDQKKMDSARSRITNAILGFIIIFAAYWLVQIAGFVLGIRGIGSMFK